MEAQEIVITVWKKRIEIIQSGKNPERLVLSTENYKKLRSYKSQLGELPRPGLDYLQKESLFGIPLFIDNNCTLAVE